MVLWIVIWFTSMPLDATTNLRCNQSCHFHYLKEAFQLHQVLAPFQMLSLTKFTPPFEIICVTACPLFPSIICPVKGYEHNHIFSLKFLIILLLSHFHMQYVHIQHSLFLHIVIFLLLNKTNVIQMHSCCENLIYSNIFGWINNFQQFFSLKVKRLMKYQEACILSMLWEEYTVLLSTLPCTYHC